MTVVLWLCFIICNLTFPLVVHLRGMFRLVLLAVLTSIIITITAIVRRNEKEAVKMLINLTIGLFDH